MNFASVRMKNSRAILGLKSTKLRRLKAEIHTDYDPTLYSMRCLLFL